MTNNNRFVKSDNSFAELFAPFTETSSSAPSDDKSVTLIKSNETPNVKTFSESQSSTETLEHKVIKSHQVIYEYPALSIMEQCAKVIPLFHGYLQEGSVIFEFPKCLFSHRTNAYQLIEKQLGPVIRNTFIPLPNANTGSINSLVINAQFCDEKTTNNAINKGVLVDGTQYKAVLYHCEFKRIKNCKKINFTIISWLQRYNHDDDLISDINIRVSVYGTVLKISKLIVNGYFEGDIEVVFEITKPQKDPSHFYGPFFGSFVYPTPYI